MEGWKEGGREGEKRNNVCIVKMSHLQILTHNVCVCVCVCVCV